MAKRSAKHLEKYQYGQPGSPKPGRKKGQKNTKTLVKALLEQPAFEHVLDTPAFQPLIKRYGTRKHITHMVALVQVLIIEGYKGKVTATRLLLELEGSIKKGGAKKALDGYRKALDDYSDNDVKRMADTMGITSLVDEAEEVEYEEVIPGKKKPARKKAPIKKKTAARKPAAKKKTAVRKTPPKKAASKK